MYILLYFSFLGHCLSLIRLSLFLSRRTGCLSVYLEARTRIDVDLLGLFNLFLYTQRRFQLDAPGRRFVEHIMCLVSLLHFNFGLLEIPQVVWGNLLLVLLISMIIDFFVLRNKHAPLYCLELGNVLLDSWSLDVGLKQAHWANSVHV